MSNTPHLGHNPQGLATFDPIADPAYRAVARRIADKYLTDKGIATWAWPEDVSPPTVAERPEFETAPPEFGIAV